MKRCFVLLLAINLVTCTGTRKQPMARRPTVADSAMVVCAHPVAAKVGADVLKKGGNAIDAAVAVQLALAVVHPAAGNLGGGGFMVFRSVSGAVTTLDYRECAPIGARENMFLDSAGNVIEGLSTDSHLASGVPGTVAGLWESHRRFGTLPWAELVTPAIELAASGVLLTEKEARGLNAIQADLEKRNSVRPEFLIGEWKPGDRLVQRDLAATLGRIRDEGRRGFYEGETARLIEEEMRRGSGMITTADLRDYKPVWREPVSGQYRGYRVYSMAPPSSGGIALLQLLAMVEPHPLKRSGHNTTRTIHLFTEAQRRVYADRAAWLGDPGFFHVPVETLLSRDYLTRRMATFDPLKATPSSAVREGEIPPPEPAETTHLSIVDAQGNAVAVTTTLNDSYGSRIVVAGAGFLLNNEMDDFSVKPGYANMYGAIGGEANKIEPSKRILSSMTPTIVERGGKLFMVVGTPGGTRIITSVFQTIVNVVDHGMDMQEAVTARRVHSQWQPDEIMIETEALTADTMRQLESMGHCLGTIGNNGRVDAILVRDDGKLEGGADPRGDDAAVGY